MRIINVQCDDNESFKYSILLLFVLLQQKVIMVE